MYLGQPLYILEPVSLGQLLFLREELTLNV